MIKNIKPIKFDPNRRVFHIKYPSSGTDAENAFEGEEKLPKNFSFTDINHLPMRSNCQPSYPNETIEKNEPSIVPSIPVCNYSQFLVNENYRMRDDFRQSVLLEPTKERFGDGALINNNNDRIKYAVCILRKPNDRLALISSIARENQGFAEEHHNVWQGLVPSKKEVETIVTKSLEVRDDMDVIRKAQLTTGLRNTKMKASDIQRVLDYLVHLGALKLLELPKPDTGRPPSPAYQILWDKTEYFKKGGTEEMSQEEKKNIIELGKNKVRLLENKGNA